MAVQTTGVTAVYTGDGMNAVFGFPNYLFEQSDLVVTVTVGGVTTNYVLNGLGATGFTFAGTQDSYGSYPGGGNVTFNVAPASGASVVITRVTPKTQQISFVDNNALPAASLEHGLDKLTLQMQEAQQPITINQGTGDAHFLGYAAAAPVGGGPYKLTDYFRNNAPASGTPEGWECVAAGSPGTWRTMGIIGDS